MSHKTVWVHGTSVQPAEPNDVNKIERHGNGAKLLGITHLGKWYHFSIPSEVGKHLVSVSVDAEIGLDQYINKVHVYHGHYKLATFDDLNLSGGRVNKAFHIAEKPEIDRAVGISILITSGPEVDASKLTTLHAAGATFD